MCSPRVAWLRAALQRPRSVAVLVFLALVFGATAAALHQHTNGRLPWSIETLRLDPAAMRAELGKAWIVALGAASTSSEHPSPARLLEDGRQLGPANALHDTIRNEGRGAYSFWGGSLYFSTADGSDPTSNGRRYEALLPTPVPPGVESVVTALAVVCVALLVVGGLLRVVTVVRSRRREANGVTNPGDLTITNDRPVPVLTKLGARLQRPIVIVTLASVALAVGAAAVCMHRHASGRAPWSIEIRQVEPAAVHRELGRAWTVPLGTTWMSSDDRPSRARLLEDGKDLGPANAQHDTIRTKGRGAFSFWSGSLYFSSSDGSDPTSNGRRYEIVWPTPLPRVLTSGVTTLAVLLGLLVTFLTMRRLATRERSWLPRWAAEPIGLVDPAVAGDDGRALWRACAWIGVVALVVRIVSFAAVLARPEDHISGLMIMGVPFSDAKGWDDLGQSVMAGQGLAGGWSARRPFLAFVIAAIYSWTGPMPTAVIVMHILLGSATAALVCRIGQRAFHPIVGFVAGLALALDPISIEYTNYLATETLGTFLFVLSMWCFFAGMQTNRVAPFWWAGVAFALSNLTRTLTLPAAPLLALAALLGGRATAGRPGGRWRRGLALSMAFCLGMGLPLGAWIVRQKLVHDLTTISDNTASGLYGAASPKYGAWTSAIDREAEDAGIPPDIKSRYDWFMQRFREELSANPSFYFDNVLQSAWIGLETLADVPPAVRSLLVLMLVAVWLSRLPLLAGRATRSLAWLGVLAATAYALLALPRAGLLLLAAFGTLAAIVQQRERLALWLLASFAATIAAGAGFALCSDKRLLLMVSWMMPMAIAHGVLVAIALVARRLGDERLSTLARAPTGPTYSPRWQTYAVRTGLCVLAATLLLVGWRNFGHPLPPLPTLTNPTLEAARAVVQRVDELRPGLVERSELEDPETWYQSAGSAYLSLDHGRLLVANVRLARHRYPLVPEMKVGNHYSRMFVKRPYERLFTYATECYLPVRGLGPGALVIATPWPTSAERDVIIVARTNVDRDFVYEENHLEVLAWAPLLPDGQPDLDRLQVTTEPRHEAYIRGLVR